jgi:hypothetical protein
VHDHRDAVLGVGLDDLVLQGLLERLPGAGDVGRLGLRVGGDEDVEGLGAVDAAAAASAVYSRVMPIFR